MANSVSDFLSNDFTSGVFRQIYGYPGGSTDRLFSGAGCSFSYLCPAESDLQRAADVLNDGHGQFGVDGTRLPVCRGAKFAFPDRPAIALVGDGAMQMNGNNVLITIAKIYLERMERPAPDCPGAQQPGSQRGDLGAAGLERGSQV